MRPRSGTRLRINLDPTTRTGRWIEAKQHRLGTGHTVKTKTTVLRVGDDVELNGVRYMLSGLDGDIAMLTVSGDPPIAIKIGALIADESSSSLASEPLRRRITGPSLLFESLSLEPGTPSNRTYDVARHSLRQRELAKHGELVATGKTMSFSTLQRLRHAYERRGVLDLVDQRLIRRDPVAGKTDQRVVDAILSVLDQNTQQSSGRWTG